MTLSGIINDAKRLLTRMQVLYREHAAFTYRKMLFALSLCCVEIPYNTLAAALFSVVRAVLHAPSQKCRARLWVQLHVVCVTV